MRSSSSDAAGTPDDDRRGDLPAAGPTQRFLPDNRTAWLRLVIVVALGLAALLGPRLLESSGAVYTDRSSVGGDIWTTPTFPPKTP